MRIPTIRKTVYEPSMDKAINTALLRAIFKELGVKYSSGSDSFTSPMYPWGVMIEDQHDDHEVEPEPHYVLKVGEGDFEAEDKKSYATRYCDYESTTVGVPLGTIATNPGTWTIHIWLPEKYTSICYRIAKNISDAYANVMAEVLPEYFIPSSTEFVGIG